MSRCLFLLIFLILLPSCIPPSLQAISTRQCPFPVGDLFFTKDSKEIFIRENNILLDEFRKHSSEPEPKFKEEQIEVLEVPTLTTKKKLKGHRIVILSNQDILSIDKEEIPEKGGLFNKVLVKSQQTGNTLFRSPLFPPIKEDIIESFICRPYHPKRPQGWLSPDGKVVSISEVQERGKIKNSILRVYNINTEALLWNRTFEHQDIYKIIFSPCSKYLTVSAYDFHVFDTVTGTPLIKFSYSYSGDIICFSPDSKIIFYVHSSLGSSLYKIFLKLDETNFDIATQYSHVIFFDTIESVNAMDVHPSLPLLAIGIYRGHRLLPNDDLRFIDYRTNKIVSYHPHYPLTPIKLRFSYDGKYLAYAIEENNQEYLNLLSVSEELSRSGKESVAVPWQVESRDYDPNMKYIIYWVHGRLGKEEKEKAAQILADFLLTRGREDYEISARWAIDRLREKAEAAVPFLIKYLTHEDSYIREKALWALCFIGINARTAVPHIIKFLEESKEERLKIIAILALGKISEKDLTIKALSSLSSESPDIKAAVKWSLERIQKNGNK